MTMSFEAYKSTVNFNAIPVQLQELPNWVFYTHKKAPIQIGAVARGWPQEGWNHGLIGNKSAGARSNDPRTWGLFSDCEMIHYQKVATGTGPASRLIAGPAIALQEELQLVVIDLDDPTRNIRDKNNPETNKPHTEEEYQKILKGAYDSQSIVLRMFNGHYIERSASGKGYHIFVLGKLPHLRYKFAYHGSVFRAGQFINMTGNTQELGIWTSYLTPQYPDPPNVVQANGKRRVEWIQRDIPLTGDIVSGKLQNGQRILDEFYNYFSDSEVGVLRSTSNDDDDKNFEDGESFEEDYCKFGRRNDLSDDQVIAKLSKGMQAVYQGGSITGDHSEDTFRLLGDLEKISASVDQIERIMKRSPRMQHAGIGNDGKPRWQKLFRLFPRHLFKARQANDNKLKEWQDKGTFLDPERHEAMRLAWERLTSEHDPSSIAYKAAAAIRAAKEREEQAKTIHVEMREQVKITGGPRFTGNAQQAMLRLSCGIHPGFLGECALPGRIGELAYYTYKGMYEPFMPFAIPAVLTALSGIIARKYKLRTKWGECPALYMVLLAKTAVGKTQAIKSIQNFQNDILFGNDNDTGQHFHNRFIDLAISSRQGFHKTLEERPCFTWVKDECAPQLKMLISPLSNDTTSEQVRSFVNELFDHGTLNGPPFRPTASVRSDKAGDAAIRNLCISTFWGTTQANIKDYFDVKAFETGIISRMLFIDHRVAGGINQRHHEIQKSLPQGAVRETFKYLLIAADQIDRAYVEPQFLRTKDAEGKETVKPNPEYVGNLENLIVPIAIQAEAEALFNNLEDQINAFKQEIHNEISDFPEHYIALSRTAMLVMRMAGIMAVFENPHQPLITYDQVAWSLGYVLRCTCGILSSFDTNDIGMITMSVANQKVMQMLRKLSKKYTSDGVPIGQLRNSLRQNSPFREHRDPTKAIDDAIFDLVDGGIIQLVGNVIRMGVRSETASVTEKEGKVRPGGPGCFALMTDHEDWKTLP